MKTIALTALLLVSTMLQLLAQCPAGSIPTGVNLVTNGDFSAGNTGFSSNYTNCQAANCLQPEATYAVGTNPNTYHGNFHGRDHTSGTGNMMIVNGTSQANASVWCQTISVKPNTQYLFSSWVTSVHGTNPAILRFAINGVQVGDTIHAPAYVSVLYPWKQFNATWNSGSDTSATICIINQNTATNGNDFGLDDISFSPCECNYTTNIIPPSGVCTGNPATLIATAGADTYTWSPETGLSNGSESSVTAIPPATTTYTLIATLNNCSDTATVTLNVFNPASVSVSDDSTVCPGTIHRLTATGGGTYSWSPATGLSSSTVAGPTFTALSNTTYTVTVTSVNGCTAADSIVITLYPAAEANAGPDTAYCFGKSVQLNASGGIKYLWEPLTGLSSSTVSNPFASGNVTADYSVKVTDVNGCEDKDFITLTVHPQINASAGSDVSLCGNAVATLNGSGGGKYSWSPATGLSSSTISTPTVSTSINTTYTLTITDAHSCTATDVVAVAVHPAFSITTGNDIAICEGGFAALSASGGPEHTWDPEASLDNPNIANPLASPQTTTTYTVVVTNTDNCTAQGMIVVQVNPNPEVTVSPDTLICLHDPLTLTAQGGATYEWSGANITGDNKQAAISVNTETSSLYIVEVSSAQGCATNDTVAVTINTLCSFVVVANAFTPNEDGLNDLITPLGKGVKEIEFEVYNRWGQKVYSTNSINGGWDGTYKGKKQPVGSYPWKLKATFNDGRTVEDAGNITLVQ